jgi:type II secretion system protein N
MKLTRRTKKILKWIGYPSFFILCFLISLTLTFPFERIQEKLQAHFEKTYGITLKMDSMSSSLPFGIKAKNVSLRSNKTEFAGLLPLDIPYIEIDVGLLSTLAGAPTVSIDSDIFGGEMDGTFAINQTDKIYKISMQADDLELDQMASIKNRFKELPVKGKLSVSTDMILDLGTIKNSRGFLEMHIEDGVVGPGKWNFELPLVKTGTFDSRFVLSEGKLEVEQFEQSSPDMMSDMRGSISLAQNLQYSRVNLDYRFKIAEHLLEKYDIFKLALSAIRNAEAPDGYFYHTFRGALTSIKPVANKAAQYKFRDKDKKSEGADPKAERPDRKAGRKARPDPATRAADRSRDAARKRAADAQRPTKTAVPPSASSATKAEKSDGRAPATPDQSGVKPTPRKRVRPEHSRNGAAVKEVAEPEENIQDDELLEDDAAEDDTAEEDTLEDDAAEEDMIEEPEDNGEADPNAEPDEVEHDAPADEDTVDPEEDNAAY